MKRNLAVWSALLALAFVAGGCVTTSPPARGVAYKGGELISTEAASIDRTWTAAEKAFKELQLLGEAKEKDGLAARMEATGAGNKRIVLKLRNQGDRLTEVRIRVGWLGDEGYSRKILEKIKDNL